MKIRRTFFVFPLLAFFAVAANAQTKVETEFRMPIYHNADRADLVVNVPKGGPMSAVVEIFSPAETLLQSTKFKLREGENICYVKGLEKYEAGRYKVNVTVGDSLYKRMLRLERIPEIAPADAPVTHRKLLFTPDEYLFESRSKGLNVRLSKPEISEAWYCQSRDAVYIVGNDFYRATDGSYIIEGVEHAYKNGLLYSDDIRPFVLKSDNPDGPYLPTDNPAPKDPDCYNRVFDSYPVMGTVSSRGKYEMFDPSRHGTYSLSDLKMLQNIDPYDYGAVKAGYRTYWTMAKTSSGDVVFLSDKPVFRDVPDYSGDTYDDGFMTNDNFGNVWFNADSTELYLLRGQTVRRNAPFDVPYDLLANCSRILTIYKTKDGRQWDYCHSVTSGGEYDSPFLQQYGGRINYLPEAGVYLVFVERYDSDAQQVSLDLEYSRDGINFHDFPGNEKGFLHTDDPSQFWFGGIYRLGGDIIQKGNRYYFMSAMTMNYPHCFAEPLFRHSYREDVTARDFEEIFSGRGMASGLPYFEKIGGWQGLADNLTRGHCAIGIISCRADGWFAVEAGRKGGKFVTRPIAGGGSLTANAEIGSDGYLVIELLDCSGKSIRRADIKGDDVAIPAFDIPEGNYRMKVRMRNAKLYALDINP